MKKRSRGFSLVEVLIVIIIIGILSGSLLVTVGSATSRGEASTIVSNLKILKTATLMYYADNQEWFSQSDEGWGVISINEMEPYLDRAIPEPYSISSLKDWGNASRNPYFIYVSGPGEGEYSTDDVHVYVAANVTDQYADYATRKQLERMSPESGIYNGSLSENLDEPSKSIFVAKENPTDIGEDGSVLMRVK